MDISELSAAMPDQVEHLTEVEYKNGISLKLRYVSRSRSFSIGKAATINKFLPGTKNQRMPELDVDAFNSRFYDEAVAGWSGVTPRSLATIYPNLDLTKIPKEKLDEPINFSLTAFKKIVKEVYELDQFVQNFCTELSNFHPGAEEEIKNSGTSQIGS